MTDPEGTPRPDPVRRELSERAAVGDVDAILELAELLEESGEREQAEEVFRTAAASGVDDILLDYAYFLEDLPGRESEAEAVYRRAIEVGITEAHTVLAVFLVVMGRTPEAEEEFSRAVASGDITAHSTYGRVLFQQGRLAEAEEQFLLGIASGDPNHNRLGNLYADLGLVEEATREYLLAIESGDDVFVEYGDLLHYQLNRTSDAEREYRRGLEHGGYPELAHFSLASLYAEQGRLVEAEEHFRLAAQGAPAYADDLADLLKAEGRTEEAETLYRVAIGAGERAAHEGYGELLLQSGRYEEAVEQLQAAYKAKPDRDTLVRLGYALSKLGRREAAARIYRSFEGEKWV